MTIDEIRRIFPGASASTIARNLSPSPAGVRPNHAQPSQGFALVGGGTGEDPRWYGAAKRFEVTYRVYSQHPCDYDGYDIKALQDLLVRSQIIPDDKWSVLSGRIVSCKVHSEAEEKTEIEIIPLP